MNVKVEKKENSVVEIEFTMDKEQFNLELDKAFKANAKYIVTQDHHYDVLKQISFPRIEVVDIDEFLSILH